MFVDGADHGGEHSKENRVLLRIGTGFEEVASVVGDGPVAVLAAAVDTLERLFMQKALEAVALGRLAQHLHDEHVVVHGEVEVLEHGRELELRGRDLVVARLRGDAELPEDVLHLGHELQDARTDRAVVVVLKLLVLRGRGPEHGAPGLQEVGTLHVEAAVDEEVLLLRAERHRDAPVRLAEMRHETAESFLERLHGAEERRLRVERLAAVRAERGGDAERGAVRVALDERGARGVPRRVAARLKGGAKTARREAGGVRLAADQVLAAERLHGLRGATWLHEAVVLLGGAAREGLEPVGEVRGALRERPVLRAQSFIACATSSAMDGSRGLPSLTVARSFAAVAFGRKARISFSPNTSSPYVAMDVSAGRDADGASGTRSAIELIACMRLFLLMELVLYHTFTF